MRSEEVLAVDAFVRTVAVNGAVPHSFFLGAGASITSGVPSAQMCIWEWKRDIFLTNNIGLEEQFTELSLPSVRQRIQQWLDKQGIYPSEGTAQEYGAFIEACYPIAESRRAFFEEKVRKAQPHVGYRLLCLLSEIGPIRSVWTTNFDALTARAAARFNITPIEVGIDSKERIARTPRSGELSLVSLHGDYRYDQLKNTASEIREQDGRLLDAMTTEFTTHHVVVIGYSARDVCVMKAFQDAFGRRGRGALYWCIQEGNPVPEGVRALVKLARAHDRVAYIVPTSGFDDLMVRLVLRCTNDAQQRKRIEEITQAAVNSAARQGKFEIGELPPVSVIKSNAFEIECPSEVLSLEPREIPEKKAWKWVEEKVAGRRLVAVPFRRKVLALGIADDLREAFSGDFAGEVVRAPISEADLRHDDGSVVALMRNGLVRALAAASGVKTNGRDEVWMDAIKERRTHDNVDYLLYESVLVWLRRLSGRQYLVLKPSLRVLQSDGEEPRVEIVKALRQEVLGWQHNREFNDAMNMWRSKLFPTNQKDGTVRVEFPAGCASTFCFVVRRSPVFAEVGGRRGRELSAIDTRFRPLMKQRGVEIDEPRLAFANRSAQGWKYDTHPVRGILNNRPFDYSLTTQGLATSVRMGVICPERESRLLHEYLLQHSSKVPAGRSESDYLPTYPGFPAAFGLPLDIAEPNSPGWITCGEPDGSGDNHTEAVVLAKGINRCIDVLLAAYAPHVVLIFFPERWAAYRGYKVPEESFDLHDFVKAYGVQRGLGTQFLEESTLEDPLRCRVWWWLSLAFYVKAMRTPWVLEGLDPNAAFVGLGLSSKYRVDKDQHLVIGCSHIYSSRGEGLQYRVSKVENPVYYQHNPFLSRDDARRVGETIRELFFDSRRRLPDRVVIHKRTRFTKDERIGLSEGLSGVHNVELLEITIDEGLRYVASAVDLRGRLSEDNYPVVRGTTVKIDDFTALLWVHGATSTVSPGRRYYQGKRRIPAPLMIRRHAGNSDLKTISEEILGLSKMNWNTFDLYTKLPATVHSSNEIARIGSLLERFGSRSYDYRLFI